MKTNSIHIIYAVGIMLLLGCSLPAFSQPGGKKEPELDLGINEDDGEETLKERRQNKKKKKNWFYGLKTRRTFLVHGVGTRQKVTSFRYLKDFKEPNEYVTYFYWYNPELEKIEKANNSRREREMEQLRKVDGKILHGPYQLKQNGEIIEQGFYYIGTKHGRWEEYKNEQTLTFKDTIEINQRILLDKKIYYKGWPKSNEISYHDVKRSKIKEVMPYDQEGTLNGKYYRYYENGKIAEKGEYEEGKKVGVWVEYFNNKRNTMKLELQYPDDPYEKDREPVVLREFGEDGRLKGGEGEDEVFDPIKKHLKR